MAETHALAQRPIYTDSQLDQYLTHLYRPIPLATSLTISSLRSQIKSRPIATISTLMSLHLSTIPWGALALHYTSHHTLPLSPPSSLFQKVVTRNFGGYCMEQNLLFSTILRSLGLEIYLSGARISNQMGDTRGKDPDGWGGLGQHMVILVSLGDDKYLVDVGFGPTNALEPVLLQEGTEVKCQPGMTGRVVKRELKGSTRRKGDKEEWWIFQNKILEKEGEDWTNGYCFGEAEWFEEDFETTNYKVSQSPRSWFTYTVILTRMILEGEKAAGGQKRESDDKTRDRAGDPEVVGSVTIFNSTVTRRIGGGKSEVLKECKTEDDRVQVLKEWFGLELSDEEREGIKGMVTELKG